MDNGKIRCDEINDQSIRLDIDHNFPPCRVLENNPVDPSHAMSRLVPETLLHLTEQHLDFYARWVRLMMLELGTESTTGGRVADLWCKSGWQR